MSPVGVVLEPGDLDDSSVMPIRNAGKHAFLQTENVVIRLTWWKKALIKSRRKRGAEIVQTTEYVRLCNPYVSAIGEEGNAQQSHFFYRMFTDCERENRSLVYLFLLISFFFFFATSVFAIWVAGNIIISAEFMNNAIHLLLPFLIFYRVAFPTSLFSFSFLDSWYDSTR